MIEIWPSYDEQPLRIELWGDDVERIQIVHHLTGDKLGDLDATVVFPAKHYVASASNVERAIVSIQQELDERLEYFNSEGKLLEAQRLKERTLYDLEMMKVLGYCSGIENYSRHVDGRRPGETPYTMLDYFPDDFVTFIDESHVTVPQIGGMANGDRARKQTLVDYGFRLPSAIDNRPLNFQEFLGKTGQTVFVSATPGPYEREVSDSVADQIIRPTGLIDPPVTVKPIQGQIEDLLGRIRERAEKGRARAHHHPDQAHVGRPHRIPAGTRRARPLHALGHRLGGAPGDYPRPAAGPLRRADRHQFAARGPRLARGVAGRHSGRRQAGLSAE